MKDFVTIERLAKAHHAESPIVSFAALRRFLVFWFARKFNLPFKSPILLSYTDEELLYEFLRYQFLEKDPREAEAAVKEATENAEWAAKTIEKIKAKEAAAKKDKEPAALPELPPVKIDF